MHHRIVIVGGGSAGVSVAARLRRAGEEDVALIEPAVVWLCNAERGVPKVDTQAAGEPVESIKTLRPGYAALARAPVVEKRLSFRPPR